jgi:cytochrome b subunit of formate dehydrogenase
MRGRRERTSGLVGVAAALVVLARVTALADEPSADDCLGCHQDPVATDAGRTVGAIAGDGYRHSTHGDLGCPTCHEDATEIPHGPLKPVGLEPCTACHADAVDGFRRSAHAALAPANGAACAGCHGDVHAVLAHDEPGAPTYRPKIAIACARCHADRSVIEKYRIPIARPVEAYLQSAHARAVAEGKRGAVCSDCHGAHAIARSSEPWSSIARARVPETCGACHVEVLRAYRASVHGEALARGTEDAPSCTDCHGEHRIFGPAEPASPVFAANLPGETCGRCHGDARLNEKFGLPATVAAFRDSFHGLALRTGKVTVANCASCHGVHDIRPSSDPRSHVSPANLAATCGKCHPGAGARFAIGPVHATAASVGGRAVAWVRVLYLWLIAVTIGGMVVHNALDLARKARTPLPPVPEPTEVAERMPRALRWQHGLVMGSFPVLVYSGFALTYPEHWWAAPFLRWEVRFGLRGILHRGAAVVLVVATVWHAVHVLTTPRLRTCLRRLVPRCADLRVLAGTLAYYVGRRAHPPHGGTFGYAEKAEYWAFLWGTVLMTVTGLLLWFENLTLRTLPAWVPEVATAIHFYEAVLATLAIVVWHLYFVIFDPAVYPMDWTWWTGRPPAHRVHERRENAGGPAAGGEPDAGAT